MAPDTQANAVATGNGHVGLVDAVKWIGAAYLVLRQEWILLGILLVIYFVLIGSVKRSTRATSV